MPCRYWRAAVLPLLPASDTILTYTVDLARMGCTHATYHPARVASWLYVRAHARRALVRTAP